MKLNYHSRKREVKRIKKEAKRSHKEKRTKGKRSPSPGTSTSRNDNDETSQSNNGDSASDNEIESDNVKEPPVSTLEEKCWTKAPDIEDKSREEEFDDYLADLLL